MNMYISFAQQREINIETLELQIICPFWDFLLILMIIDETFVLYCSQQKE